MRRRTLAVVTVASSVAMGAIGGAVLFAPLSSLAAGANLTANETTIEGCEGHGPMSGHLEVAAETIGIDPADLLDRLSEGETVAEVAQDEGVEVDTVIDAMVADGQERLDQAVEDGYLTPRHANRIAQNMQERVTTMVNGEFPDPGRLHRLGGHDGDGMGPGLGGWMHD